VPGFRPSPLLSGGHLQTIGGHLLRFRVHWKLPVEEATIEAGDGARILVRASWQPERERPALLLLHGLEGCDRSPNVICLGMLAHRQGWHVVRMNLRGCGDSLPICPSLYNAGLTSDLLAVSRWVAARVPRFAITGFSLGGNLTLLTLSRERARLPGSLFAAAAICPPLDMSACASALEQPWNRLYQFQFVSSLNRSYRRRQRLRPDLYEPGRERGVSTVREFDSRITAFYGGYRDAEDYYQRVSPGPCLSGIDRGTLILAAADDPFIPAASVSRWSGTDAVSIEIAEGGGHVGFVGRSTAPGRFWAADRVLGFLESVDRVAQL
ncbi:MAG TPA: alpha/beta fold hydrolase, partial [Vicinamibacteria bacterium]